MPLLLANRCKSDEQALAAKTATKLWWPTLTNEAPYSSTQVRFDGESYSSSASAMASLFDVAELAFLSSSLLGALK